MSDALNEPVVVAENGTRRKITKREAIVKQLVNQSATANWRAIKILLDLVRELEGQTGPTSPETASFTEADEKVIARYTGLTGSSDAERIGAVVPGPHCR